MSPRPTGPKWQDNLKNQMNEEKQMTSIEILDGASSVKNSDKTPWQKLPWSKFEKDNNRLQMRIAKAEREGKKGKVKALQRILTCSFTAKSLAIKRVTTNKGGKTSGIDGIIWRTSRQKIQAVKSLKRRGYKALPSKRIYIPKNTKGKLRPLSIPRMKDRAMQALWTMALVPIAEERADQNSYGFRPKRSTMDACEQCFKCLSTGRAAKWIFEGDIHSCFDKISHQWLIENIPMDKIILKKFLKAGYMEKQKLYFSEFGTGQGSIISPTLALMTLTGIENRIRSAKERQRALEKINVISYADDFIITGNSKELIEEKVIPIVTEFLKERGLELSQEKSKITSIDEGFDFLGFNVRKYRGKLLIKPRKANVKGFLKDIRKTIKDNKSAKTENLIWLLNSKIRSWSNYYRSAVSSKTYSYVDEMIYKSLKSWMFHRHPNKGKPWINKKYFIKRGLRQWNFHAITCDKEGNQMPIYLYRASETKIKRHIKIRGKAHPYNPEFKEYFKHRDNKRKTRKVVDNVSTETKLLCRNLLGGSESALSRA